MIWLLCFTEIKRSFPRRICREFCQKIDKGERTTIFF